MEVNFVFESNWKGIYIRMHAEYNNAPHKKRKTKTPEHNLACTAQIIISQWRVQDFLKGRVYLRSTRKGGGGAALGPMLKSFHPVPKGGPDPWTPLHLDPHLISYVLKERRQTDIWECDKATEILWRAYSGRCPCYNRISDIWVLRTVCGRPTPADQPLLGDRQNERTILTYSHHEFIMTPRPQQAHWSCSPDLHWHSTGSLSNNK